MQFLHNNWCRHAKVRVGSETDFPEFCIAAENAESLARPLVPRSTLFYGSEPTKRAKTALQPLEIVHYSLRATPCLDAPSEL
uniref:Uncharacterized protein n=1 Tax=Candidatus Kentrum sp. DK TaxID=2126562 RepID=A0A450RZ10_9GAMM|nr:MAG: hypothetical protein BECKDK2373C_GA0170839_100841 [Candidatus Kentron sp. DK]VFJ46408.1 MAG: hypothetical protein BECKDK2373B_GA0170837_101318 [Candidatus Kentron sp. DK]